MTFVDPPTSRVDLMRRAHTLAGKNLQFVADRLGIKLPERLDHHKGVIGQMLEDYLGANASSLSEPDFMGLGIELKSIPISAAYRPKESTFVCSTPLCFQSPPVWGQSSVKKKLSTVLWIPVEADPDRWLADRRIGIPILWSPDTLIAAQLQADWEELIELLYLGRVDKVSAAMGTYLQIRPKGANASALVPTINQSGEYSETLPRGFYLRTTLTAKIIADAI